MAPGLLSCLLVLGGFPSILGWGPCPDGFCFLFQLLPFKGSIVGFLHLFLQKPNALMGTCFTFPGKNGLTHLEALTGN